jgi:tight adherence protein C
MIWTITIVTFLGTVAVCAAVVYALSTGDLVVAKRLSSLWNTTRPQEEVGFRQKQKDRLEDLLAGVGKLLPGSGKPSRMQLLLLRAGYRRAQAAMVVRGVTVLLPIAAVATVYFTGLYLWNPFLLLVGAAALGYLLPEFWLLWRVKKRKLLLRLALPDALDLLVICVEAGLGLDQAIMRVSQELRIAHPELSDELQLVNLEMRVGKNRLDALRSLAIRTGVEDIKALVAMLVQTDRFGTSVAQSLRVHSDDLRTRRRQRAEEMAAKTTVKMVPPLVFFIFPALMVVILGPAVITVARELLPALK